jgi:peptidoglycan hydrolase-like protein with peptidoglycan-binding domain
LFEVCVDRRTALIDASARLADYAERHPVRLLRPAAPEMGRQSQRFVLEFRDEAGDDCQESSGRRSNRHDSEPGRRRFVKTNDEMAKVRALIASLLAEKAEILLRIERAGAGIAAALKDLGSPIPPLALDGAAGAGTKRAALAFQTPAHLATDAIVGPLTWKKLVKQDF